MAFETSDILSQPGYGIPQLQSLDQQNPQGFITPQTIQGGGFPVGTGLEELNLADILGIAKAAPNQVLQAPVMGSKMGGTAIGGGIGNRIGGMATAGLAPEDVTGDINPLEGTTFAQRFLMNLNPAYAKAFTQRQALKRKTDAAREVTGLIAESNKLAMQGDLEGAEDILTERMKTFKYAPEAQGPVLEQVKYLRHRQSQSALGKLIYNSAKEEVEGNPKATPLFKQIVAMGREAEARAKVRKSGQTDYSAIISAVGEEGIATFTAALANAQEVNFTPEGGGVRRRNIAGTVESAGDVDRPIAIGQLLGNEFMQSAAGRLVKQGKIDGIETIRRNMTNPNETLRNKAYSDWNQIILLGDRIRDVRGLTHGQRQYLRDQGIAPSEESLINMSQEQYERVISGIPKEVAGLQGQIASETELEKTNQQRRGRLHRILPALSTLVGALDAIPGTAEMEQAVNVLSGFGLNIGRFRIGTPEGMSVAAERALPFEKSDQARFAQVAAEWVTQALGEQWEQSSQNAGRIRELLDERRWSNKDIARQTAGELYNLFRQELTIIDDPQFGRKGKPFPDLPKSIRQHAEEERNKPVPPGQPKPERMLSPTERRRKGEAERQSQRRDIREKFNLEQQQKVLPDYPAPNPLPTLPRQPSQVLPGEPPPSPDTQTISPAMRDTFNRWRKKLLGVQP